jgi:hypothetical protein
MATSSESLGRRRWILLLALLLVVKGALVLSLADVFQWGEEFEKAAAAKAMLDGLDVPHHQLAYHYYEGGGFVASHLTAVAFLLVGENLLALKLVALGFQLALLVVGCSFTRDLFGARAGACFGLLFILGPESFQKLSLIDLGIHFEACLFLLGVLGLGRGTTWAWDSSRASASTTPTASSWPPPGSASRWRCGEVARSSAAAGWRG